MSLKDEIEKVKSLTHNSIPFLRLLPPEEELIVQGTPFPSNPGSFHVLVVELVILFIGDSMEHFGSISSRQVHGSFVSHSSHCGRVFPVECLDFCFGMFQIEGRFPRVVFCRIPLPSYSVFHYAAMASRVQYFFHLILFFSLDFNGWQSWFILSLHGLLPGLHA